MSTNQKAAQAHALPVAPAHTPTPWVILEVLDRVVIHPGTLEAGKNNGKRMIAEFRGTDKRANARFVRRAVNNHAQLLELLVLALPSVEESEEFNKPNAPKLSARIRAALR